MPEFCVIYESRTFAITSTSVSGLFFVATSVWFHFRNLSQVCSELLALPSQHLTSSSQFSITDNVFSNIYIYLIKMLVCSIQHAV